MPHLAGKKISGSHTTVIEAVEPLVVGLQKDPRVSKISLGPIDNTTGGHTGQTRVKIIDEKTCIILSVSGSGSHQEIRVFLSKLSDHRRQVKERVEKLVKQEGFGVNFLDRR